MELDVATIDLKTIIDRIRKTESYEKLRNIERNIGDKGVMTATIEAEIKAQYGALARQVVADKTGIDLENLSPAEEKIVLAVAEYVGIMTREHKTTSRTFQQLKNRGLIGAAEAAVSQAKPTLGFTVLNDADRAELSYEQIIIHHPDEFSKRALWFARRALGHVNHTSKPPVSKGTSPQARTELLLAWLKVRRSSPSDRIKSYTNADTAISMGIGDISKFGRAQAIYSLGLISPFTSLVFRLWA